MEMLLFIWKTWVRYGCLFSNEGYLRNRVINYKRDGDTFFARLQTFRAMKYHDLL